MKIADLFVALGVKGADKSAKDVGQVSKAMKGARDMSLEAKAAIVGAFYAAQQMFSKSGEQGRRLNQFSHMMDTTTEALQRYQYAARQFGATNEDVENSLIGIQKAMTDIIMGRGVPTGFGRLAEAIGFEEGDALKYQKNPELFLSKMFEASRRYSNKAQFNEDVTSTGITQSLIPTIKNNGFRPDVLARADVYSEKEAKSLARVDTAWGNLLNKIEMAFGRFNSKHGMEIVQGFDKIISALIKLADVAIKAAKDMKAFDLLKSAVELTGEAIKNIAWFVKELSDATKGEGDLAKLKPALDAITSFIKGMLEIAGVLTDDTIEKYAKWAETGQHPYAPSNWELPTGTLGWSSKVLGTKAGVSPERMDAVNNIVRSIIDSLPMSNLDKSIEVMMRLMKPSQTGAQPPKVEINNTMNFSHDGKDATRTSKEVSRETFNAFKSSPAQAWGN